MRTPTSGLRSGRGNGRRGAALIVAIIAVSSLTVMGVALLQVTTSSSAVTRSQVDNQRARLLAEAGVHEAMDAMRAGGTGGVGSQAGPAGLGNGLFWVTATDLGGDLVQLTSTALQGKGRAAVGAVVRRPVAESPLFASVINSDEDLTMNAAVVTDSFDSSLGDYASQQTSFANGHAYAKDGGDVLSNANIILNARATVFGDATPGPSGGVSYATDSSVTGSDKPAPELFNFPPIAPPKVALGAPVTVPNGTAAKLAPGDYGVSQLSIGKDALLRIVGPATLYMDTFSGGKDATLEIDARDGPVTIYTTDYSHISGFRAINVPGSPMALAFFVSGTNDVVFPSATEVRGAYYLPNAAVTFTSSNEAWGAFAAKRISMSNDMRFHFDEDLMSHWTGDTNQGDGNDPDVVAWFEAAVEPRELRSDRSDPLTALGIDRGDVLDPERARTYPE